MSKPEYKEKILEQIDMFVLKHIKFNEVDYFIENYKFYLDNANYNEKSFEKMKMNKDIVPVKMAIIDDVQYINNFDDDDINIIRFFTLTTPTEIQYFTSTGSRDYFGEPKEHTRNEFLYLLDNHPNLKDNDIIKHMKSFIFYNELQENLCNKENENKKLKI
jgi:hypothetical protein